MNENYLQLFSRKSMIFAKRCYSANHFLSKVVMNSLLLLNVSLLQAQCPSPPGNPAIFGNNVWNVYGYNNSDLTLATAEYYGYYTQSTLEFDTQNIWNPASSPTNAEGWNGCTLDNESFTFVYKRKGFPCGTYTVAMPEWDDAAIVYVDGVEQWSCADTSCDGSIGDIVLNENSEIEIRVREDGGNAFAVFTLLNNTPTIAGTLTPTGSTTICANTKPGAITLAGNSAAVVKWQSAEDYSFTVGVTDIDMASISNTLASDDMGKIPATRYYRAVIQDGSCYPQYTDPVEITVPLAVTYANGLWDSLPTATTPIIIEDDMILSEDLTVCSCEVKNGKTLTVSSEESLTVVTTVTVETGSQLIIEDKASLVQLDDTAVNSGIVGVKRNSQPMKLYDYTYWSSPVQDNTLYDLSPLTAGDKYYRFNPIINNWVSIIGGNEVMEAGRGYIIRAPQGWAVTNPSSGVYSGQFNGVPNNGIIPATIEKGAGTFNLIGNPYPSAIDIDLFLSDPNNTTVVNGTIYLWTHNTAISTSAGNVGYNYTADDYAKYNLTGGVRSAAPAVTGGSVPDGKIASGQGFFIEAATALANGSYTVNFNNSMRIMDSNNNFYRTAHTAHSAPVLEKNRLWISVSNTEGAYNQVLLGYITNATNGADDLFDGKPMASANVLSMYSINGTDNYSIQGRALPFDNSDVVPLGYKSTIAGNFNITLEDFDGLFESQDVYLVDQLNNVTHDLKAGAYAFTSGIGTFNDRFEIQYVNNTLAVNNPLENQTGFSVSSNNGHLSVKAQSEMTSITVYDLLGRMVYQSGTIHTNEFKASPSNLKNQMLIVKAIFENGTTAYKKAMIN